MIAPTRAQTEAAKVLHQLKWLYSADGDERDPKALEIIAAALTAAAEAGEPKSQDLHDVIKRDLVAAVEDATIERCAQVAEEVDDGECGYKHAENIAASIRALKEEP